MSKNQAVVADPKEQLPANVLNYEDYAGHGAEFEQDEMTIPFLKLLQKMSPEVDEVEGAKVGMFYNTATGTVYPSTVRVVPVMHTRQFLKWTPKSEGGGFRGVVPMQEALALPQNDSGKYMAEDGDEIQDTRVYYVLHLTEEGAIPCIVSFKSTSIKNSKAWNTLISNRRGTRKDGSQFTLPSFSAIYELSSLDREKDGNKWKVAAASFSAPLEDAAVFQQAVEFYNLIKSNEVKVDYNESEDTSGTTANNSFDDDDVEF